MTLILLIIEIMKLIAFCIILFYTTVNGYNLPKSYSSDIDYCADSPCLNGGLCENVYNGYRCMCPTDLTGSRCEHRFYGRIAYHNHCASNPCSETEICINYIDGFRCTCKHERYDCEIPNDCESSCLNGEICTNLESVDCKCKPGYTGEQCEELSNPCKVSPCHESCPERNNYHCKLFCKNSMRFFSIKR